MSKTIVDITPRGKSYTPLGGTGTEKKAEFVQLKEIVGHCPTCGAPIYGAKTVADNSPSILYSCQCLTKSKSFEESIQTK